MTSAAVRGPARWPLGLAIALSLVALVTLIWLRNRLVQEEQTSLANALRVFESSGVLLHPENDAISFSLIESTAESFEQSELIARLLVSKRTLEDGEVLVYPFYHALLDPDWKQGVSSWERLRVGPGDNPHGWLYVELAPANRRAVDRVILLFAALLIICLGVLVFRQRGKEIELSRTVSELERRQAEVIRLERLALAGQLSANIFHDIKKPILNIKHESEDLLESEELEAEVKQSVEAMREQTELFLRILRELGFEQFVRAGEESSEYCDVAEMIDRAVSLVKYEQAGVEVSLEVPRDGTLPLVFAPPHRLIQLFSNLILNAYQAMEGKGTLSVRAAKADHGVHLEFEDTGSGIPETTHEDIFDPFVTSKGEQGGSGLGLFICERIVSDLKGTIRLAESSASGTRFTVSLPEQEPS